MCAYCTSLLPVFFTRMQNTSETVLSEPSSTKRPA